MANLADRERPHSAIVRGSSGFAVRYAVVIFALIPRLFCVFFGDLTESTSPMAGHGARGRGPAGLHSYTREHVATPGRSLRCSCCARRETSRAGDRAMKGSHVTLRTGCRRGPRSLNSHSPFARRGKSCPVLPAGSGASSHPCPRSPRSAALRVTLAGSRPTPSVLARDDGNDLRTNSASHSTVYSSHRSQAVTATLRRSDRPGSGAAPRFTRRDRAVS